MVSGLNAYGYGYDPYNTTRQTYSSPEMTSFNYQPILTGGVAKDELPDKFKTKKDDPNDGHIGFWKATGSFLKGVGKFFTGMVTDKEGNFSIGQTLKTLAIGAGVAAVCVLTAGTAVPAMIAAAGVATAGIGLGKSVVDIATAKTDAECEAAFESLGSSATATTLAVVGAKAVAKASAANAAEAAEFNGIKGSFKAVGKVFRDSGNAIADSASGVANAFKAAPGTISGKWSAVKSEVSGQYSEFAGTVKNNYNNAVYGAKGKVTKETESIDKQVKDIETKQSEITDTKSTEYKNLEAQKAELQAKQSAMKKVNEASTWEEGNDIVSQSKKDLAEYKQQVEANKSTMTKEQVAKANSEIKVREQSIKAQEEVLSRRTSEAQHIKSSIEAKEAQIKKLNKADTPNQAKIDRLNSEIAELKARQEFELPTEKINANEVTQSNKRLNNANRDVKVAEQKLADAQKALEKVNKSDAAALEKAKNAVADAEYDLAVEKYTQEVVKSNAEPLNAKYEAQTGKARMYAPTEILKAGKDMPAARWITVETAGRQFLYDAEADFYSKLSAQERQYIFSLPEAQRQAVIEQYKNIA